MLHNRFPLRVSAQRNIYKIDVESFGSTQHLRRIADEVRAILDTSIATEAEPQVLQ